MELLYTENHKDNDETITFEWHQTNFKTFEDIQIDEIIDYLKKYDYQYTTFFYFYTKIVVDDAIGDKVRTMITIRYKDNKFTVNFNTSDFVLAMHMDEVLKLNQLILKQLNN